MTATVLPQMKKFLFLFVLVAVAFKGVAAPFDIGEAVRKAEFWGSDPVMFVKNHIEEGFSFTSETREGADSRYYGAVAFFSLPVYETKVTFSDGGISRVEAILFSSGGSETYEFGVDMQGRRFRRTVPIKKMLGRKEYFDLLENIRKNLSGSAKVPQVKTERLKNNSGVVRTQVWPKTSMSTQASLAWSFRQDGQNKATFSPGFIRVTIDGPRKVEGQKKLRGAKVSKSAKHISANVVKDPRGDVFIDNIPMVDQGQKGYCAAATAERVLKYYGVDIDEHEVAQAAGTTAEQGTSILAMKNAIESIGKKYRLATVVSYGDFDADVKERIEGLEDEVKDYNRMARKMRFPLITEDVYITRTGSMITYSPSAARGAMKVEVLKEMKVNGAQRSKYLKFLAEVRKQVSMGVPIFWGLELGIYPESGSLQAGGGHMRLIIGFNEKKKEILYTDSWGAGHELKRMPSDWAFAVSRCVMYMKPAPR